MDTVIGTVKLTVGQTLNFKSVNIIPFIGFSYNSDSGALTGVSLTEPTPDEITKALVAVEALSSDPVSSVAQQIFNTDVFLLGLDGILGTLSNFTLRLEGSNIGRFCDAKNFTGLKQYIQLLIVNSIATKADYDKINAICKQQFVDLDNL